jgi:hypothetical protein
MTDSETAGMTAIGTFLGTLYRAELADRIRLGRIDRRSQVGWRTERKREITAKSSSRWAGAITRTVEDQYQLGMRAVAANIANLRAAVALLEKRCALPPGAVGEGLAAGNLTRRVRGYRSAAERFTKSRRLGLLQTRLAAAELAWARGRPSIVVGGKRLWRSRNHLDMTGVTEQEWRHQWDAARMFLTADGESGVIGGNLTIRVDETGRLQIKTPAALVERFGEHISISMPVRFSHRADEWSARVAARRAVRYDVSFDSKRGRWYLDASWKATPQPPTPLEHVRAHRVLGVDLNVDHLAVCVLDKSGNPTGQPITIAMVTAGLPAGQRDGRLRAAITSLLDHAEYTCSAAIVVENLNFADARATGRETRGRGGRGKALRRMVAGIPTARFCRRLTAMATRRGITVIGVDAAYTSKWGGEHWMKPLQEQTSDPATVTGHHAAAAAIGRRGLGLAIRRRPAGPRSGQRTAAGTPLARPGCHPGTTRLRGSSGSPVRRTPAVSVHRRTRASGGQDCSDRPRAGPTPAR